MKCILVCSCDEESDARRNAFSRRTILFFFGSSVARPSVVHLTTNDS